VRLWNINPNDSSSNAANPGKLDTGASVTGIHFSEQCMEILTTHGDAIGSNEKMANSVSVHTASLRHVTTLKSPSNKPIGDSVLNSTRMKVVFTVPYEGKINIYDAWAKRKELRREGSRIRDGSLYIR
jgi:cell division cycle protein 20 (cofactor of APC complex)